MKTVLKIICFFFSIVGIIVLVNSAIEILYQGSKNYFDSK